MRFMHCGIFDTANSEDILGPAQWRPDDDRKPEYWVAPVRCSNDFGYGRCSGEATHTLVQPGVTQMGLRCGPCAKYEVKQYLKKLGETWEPFRPLRYGDTVAPGRRS